MLHRVALVRIDVSEELSASFITVTRIGELGTTIAVNGNGRTLRRNRRLLAVASIVPSSPILVTLMEALNSSETSVRTRTTGRNVPEDAIVGILSLGIKYSYLKSITHSQIQKEAFVFTSIPHINLHGVVLSHRYDSKYFEGLRKT
jgi:hypothetical protein